MQPVYDRVENIVGKGENAVKLVGTFWTVHESSF